MPDRAVTLAQRKRLDGLIRRLGLRYVYGQRLAVSSHPAARAGCGVWFTAGCGMRIGCWGTGLVVAKVGLLLVVSAISFSSESSGAATRSASTSFSSLASSNSF